MLTEANYHSKEMNQQYFSTSQIKDFLTCEALALAKINEEWVIETSVAFLVGSYVDAHFSGSLELFKAQNPEIFTKKMELRSNYVQADKIIERIENDEMLMNYLSGEKQVIKTGEIDGVPFKTKIDSYHKGKAIVDLKIMKDFKKQWKDGIMMNFIDFYGYDIQGAIYQAIEGNNLNFIIAGATKEKVATDIGLFYIPQPKLDKAIKLVKDNLQRFVDVKSGKAEPLRCEKCDYCKSTRKLDKVISYEELDNIG